MSWKKSLWLAILLFLPTQPIHGQERGRQAARTDAYGDPLPQGAIARLGTMRLRNCWSSVVFSFDSKLLAYSDFELRIWVCEVGTGKPVHCFEDGDRKRQVKLVQLLFCPDNGSLVAGYDSGNIHSWDLRTGRKQFSFHCSDYVSSLAFSPDGERLAVGLLDSTVLIHDSRTNKQLFRLTEFKDSIRSHCSVAFVAGGSRLVVLTLEEPAHGSRVGVWDTQTGKMLNEFGVEYGEGLNLHSSGRMWSRPGGPVLFWDPLTGSQHPVGDNIDTVLFSPDGRNVYLSGRYHSERIIDLPTETVVTERAATASSSYFVALASNGKVIAYQDDRIVRLLDPATGKETVSFSGHQSNVHSLRFLADGKHLAACDWDGTVCLWDLATMQLLKQAQVGERASSHETFRFAPDGKSLAISGYGKLAFWSIATLSLWDVLKLEKRAEWPAHTASIYCVAYSPDGKTLASGSANGCIALWNARNGSALRTLRPARLFRTDEETVNRLAFGANDSLAAMIGYKDRRVHLWDTAAGTKIGVTAPVPGFDGFHSLLVPFPVGNLLAAAPVAGGGPTVWDPNLAQWRSLTSEYAFQASKLFASADGRLIALTSYLGNSFRVLEAITGDVVTQIQGDSFQFAQAEFSPDARYLATAGTKDCSILIFAMTGPPAVRGDPLPRKQIESLWNDVTDSDGRRAYPAIGQLAAGGPPVLAFLQSKLQPVAGIDAARIDRLLADLASNDFNKRAQAEAELRKLGELAGPALAKAATAKSELDYRRRIEQLLKESRQPRAHARAQRVTAVLEYMATAEAQALLQKLANGAAEAWLTREARAAVRRLREREQS